MASQNKNAHRLATVMQIACSTMLMALGVKATSAKLWGACMSATSTPGTERGLYART